MYVILSNEEYESLIQTPGKASLFMDRLENELRLKKDNIEVYEQIGSKDIANNLRHEYSGMQFVKDIFLKIMKV